MNFTYSIPHNTDGAPPMQYRRPFRPDTPLPHPKVPAWATWLATVGMLAALVFAVTAVV
jgi:hypothetical protein